MSALHEMQQRRLRIKMWNSKVPDFESILKKVCAAFDVDQADVRVRHRGGPASMARKAFAWLCVRNYEIPTTAVAEFLKVSPGAASNMLGDGEKIVSGNKELSI